MGTPIRLSRASLVAGLAASLFAALPATSLVIDNFEVGDFTHSDQSTPNGASTIEVAGLPNGQVKGGVRYVRQRVTTTSALLAVSTVVLVTTAGDDAAAISSVGVDVTVDTEFSYDGIENLTVDGVFGTLDLDLSAYDFFELVATAPGVDANVIVTLWSSVTAQTSGLVPLVDGITSIALSNFTLDVSDIQSIRVEIKGMSDGEVVNLSLLRVVVPEPTTGLLLASGLLGLAARRRATQR